MKQEVRILTDKAIFQTIYIAAINSDVPVPLEILEKAVQNTALHFKASVSKKMFDEVLNKMAYRNIVVEVDEGEYKGAHAS